MPPLKLLKTPRELLNKHYKLHRLKMQTNSTNKLQTAISSKEVIENLLSFNDDEIYCEEGCLQDANSSISEEWVPYFSALFACGQEDRVRKVLTNYHPKTDAWVPLLCRLGILDVNTADNSHYKWLRFAAHNKEELIYPLNITRLDIVLHQNQPVLRVYDICPCCHGVTPLTAFSPLLWNGIKNTSQWLCPNCLARRSWDILLCRSRLWDIYRNKLEQITVAENGLLCQDSALVLFNLALAFLPIAPVRFGYIDTREFGHLFGDPTMFINMKAQGYELNSLDYFCPLPDAPVSNHWLLQKWESVLQIQKKVTPIAELALGTPLSITALMPPDCYAVNRDVKCTSLHALPPFSFTADEQQTAWSVLERMGLPAGASFVCLNVREKSFWDTKKQYWTDRQAMRFDDIDYYKAAAEYLVKQGYYVLRMGASISKELTWASDHIIDYAAHYRSEFMDVWLFANCALYLGTQSGPRLISGAFRRPAVITRDGLYVRGYNCMHDALLLPMIMRNVITGELVTSQEIVHNGFYRITDENILRRHGVMYEACSPSDILEATQEKLAIMRGEWAPDPLVERLQRLYALRAITISVGTEEEKRRAKQQYLSFHGAAVPNRVFSRYLLAEYEQEQRNRQRRRTAYRRLS